MALITVTLLHLILLSVVLFSTVKSLILDNIWVLAPNRCSANVYKMDEQIDEPGRKQHSWAGKVYRNRNL